MVKIPELAEDGQNWKIYRAKFLEVAATFNCLKVLAGRPYEGDDWDGCNALLCCTFMESVPPSIYFKIRRRTAHKNFKYLAKRFRDNDPIPCANELQCAGTAAAAEMPEKSPTSDITATERHASAEWNNEDLSTKALTRGTQDINDGNVRRTQDLRTSLEALAQGTSAKCTETTSVILKSVLQELQTEPQSSLPLTPRLPIDGEPSRCKQEAADSIVAAERTKQMVKLAEPTETDADIDRMALLGREPAEMACGVDEGDRTEHESKSWLQQTKLLCGEIVQRSGNATENIPIANGLPLEGEWLVYASGKMTNSNGDADALSAATEHVNGPSESRETEDAMENESRGCKGGTSEGASADGAVGDAGHGVEPAEMSNVLETLITLSIKSEDLHSSGIPHVCLGGMSCHAGDANRPGN